MMLKAFLRNGKTPAGRLIQCLYTIHAPPIPKADAMRPAVEYKPSFSSIWTRHYTGRAQRTSPFIFYTNSSSTNCRVYKYSVYIYY